MRGWTSFDHPFYEILKILNFKPAKFLEWLIPIEISIPINT